MWHVDPGFSEEELIPNSRSSISTHETVLPSHSNALMGIVSSKTERLTRTTLRIRVGTRTDLRVSWQTALTSPGIVNIGIGRTKISSRPLNSIAKASL